MGLGPFLSFSGLLKFIRHFERVGKRLISRRDALGFFEKMGLGLMDVSEDSLFSGVGIRFNFERKIAGMYCTNAVLLMIGNMVKRKAFILCRKLTGENV